jgi:uncharacterized Tic20 family protein
MSEMDETQPPPPPGSGEPADSVNLGKPDGEPMGGDVAPPSPIPESEPGQAQPSQTQPGQTQPGQTQPGQTQPGWYPDPQPGQLRWFDGQLWGAYQSAGAGTGIPATTGDPKNTAALAHYLGAALFALTCSLGFLGPLIIFSGQGKEDPFVRDQAAEALNFQLTILIGALVCGVLVFVVVGIFLLPFLWLFGVIMGVVGGMAAGNGTWYRYPLSIKFVRPS